MASGNSQQHPAVRPPAAGMVFLFQSPSAMAPVQQPIAPATHFFVPQAVLMPPAFRAPAPLPPLMPMAPVRFVRRLVLPPRPPRTPAPSPVAGVPGTIAMVPLEPNQAFWAPYRYGNGRPVELDFLGLFGGPATPVAMPDPDDNASETSSPSFKIWIHEEGSSSVDMEVDNCME